MQTVLPTLIAPMSQREFFAKYWTAAHVCFQPRPDVVKDIFDSLKANSLDQFMQLAAEPVLVIQYTEEGRYRPSAATMTQALALLKLGSTVYFDLRRNVTAVKTWILTLSHELGVDPAFVSISMFASPPGAWTEWHFDSKENLTLQLAGTKRWLISPATVSHPIQRFTTTGPCPPSLHGLESQLRLDVEEAARNHDTFDLTAGTALYIPRGAWHMVTALETSLSITFSVGAYTWEHVVVTALRKRLLKDPYWRRFAGARGGAGLPMDDGSPQLSEIIERLLTEASRLAPSDLLTTTGAPTVNASERIE